MKKNTKRTVLVFTLAMVLFAGIGAMGMRYMQREDHVPGKGLVLDQNAEEWDKTLADTSGGQKGIKIPGYADITVSKEDKNWKISLVNPEDNPCYFQYSLEIAETGKTLYESDLIEPGKAIKEFTPQNVPGQGDYELYLNISTYSYDEEKVPMNGAKVKAELHIL